VKIMKLTSKRRSALRATVQYTCLALALFFLAGCEVQFFFRDLFHPETDNPLDLTSRVVAPVGGEEPDSTAISIKQYNGTIAWYASDGVTPFSGPFVAGDKYKATVTLDAKGDYTFPDDSAAFIHDGADTITWNDTTREVKITFTAS
jgi:hypothetical protein